MPTAEATHTTMGRVKAMVQEKCEAQLANVTMKQFVEHIEKGGKIVELKPGLEKEIGKGCDELKMGPKKTTKGTASLQKKQGLSTKKP
mgnify:CR=1 FL=1